MQWKIPNKQLLVKEKKNQIVEMTSIICKLHHIQKFCTISWRKGHNPCCKYSTTVDHHEIQTKYNNLKGKQKNLLTSS